MKIISTHSYTILIAIFILAIIILPTLSYVLTLTNNTFVYALDDTYIHMAMAKNLALHGVYGVTQYEFSSASSSPFWTVLLGGLYSIFGVSEYTPFIVNVVCAVAIIILLQRILSTRGVSPFIVTLVLFFIILAAPMNALILMSMEHVLQILLVLLFVWYFLKILDTPPSTAVLWKLALCTAPLALTRFESYFLFLISGFLLMFKKQWRAVLILFISAVVPLLIFQIISVTHGWFLLPNPVLIKSHTTGFPNYSHQFFSSLGSILQGAEYYMANALENYYQAEYIVFFVGYAVILSIVLTVYYKTLNTPTNLLLIMYIFLTVLHILFARFGAYFRYEAYLIVLGIVVLSTTLPELITVLKAWSIHPALKAFIVLIGIYFSIPSFTGVIKRAKTDLLFTPLTSRNIYEQQYQMARFLKKYYNSATVALNDIGAVTYYSDIRLVDVVGLASVEVLRLAADKNYTTAELYKLCKSKDVDIAIVYDDWVRLNFFPPPPPQWKKICYWKIPYNVICGDYIVTFYAVKEHEVDLLRKRIEEFSPELPPTVKVEFVDEHLSPPKDEFPYNNETRAQMYNVYY
ncbi:MAG: hypothetical protein N3A63_02025 [Bacteroidetes bacterium]|nr:hypothetical protein [Bacteroidota bacterium]